MEDPFDSKPSKVQTFFQISITALAFLSFAGYLLCMIVQAIKTKGKQFLLKTTFIHLKSVSGTMYMYPNSLNMVNGVNTMNSIVNSGSVPLRKRRPLGRKRRNVFLSGDNQNKTNSENDEESSAMIDPAEMYNVMIQCAEDYTKFYYIQ